ncbi:STAS domain-containing protein [Halosaccharopolyspora lacisalsi]|uniref:STAS domain-containing protein n=1 Tax=Halosaccharopolyspora lacisalsi TaxID=1000566 RepID=UPI0015FD086F|nr:STAS domain-containing protein [Halosaccharopolyspora lacisalsi]
MLTKNPVTDRASHTEVPAGAYPTLLRTSYTEPHVQVLSAAGDLDLATTPQLEQLLWPRLQTTLSALVVDLSEVTFLCLAGVELLAHAHAYAGHRGIAFGVVNSNHAVDRALTAGELQASLPCFGSVPVAVEACRHLIDGHSQQKG